MGSVLVKHPKEITQLRHVPVGSGGPQPGALNGLDTPSAIVALSLLSAREKPGPRCARACPIRVIARAPPQKADHLRPSRHGHQRAGYRAARSPTAQRSEAAGTGFEPAHDRLQSRDAHALGAEHTRAPAPGKVFVGNRDSGTFCHPGTWINTQGKNEYLGPPKEMHQNVPNDEKLDLTQTSNSRRIDT